MNAHERAAKLMEDAEKLGCDTPTESMIAEAINDAESDCRNEIAATLIRMGMPKAASAVDRWERRLNAESFLG